MVAMLLLPGQGVVMVLDMGTATAWAWGAADAGAASVFTTKLGKWTVGAGAASLAGDVDTSGGAGATAGAADGAGVGALRATGWGLEDTCVVFLGDAGAPLLAAAAACATGAGEAAAPATATWSAVWG